MKRKSNANPKKPPDADLLSVPGMESLDQLTRQVLKVPKEEMERLLEEDRQRRNSGHST